jgi:hypothetical protein
VFKQILRAFSLLSFLVCVAPIEAATHIWTGAVNELFSVPGNWSGGSPAGDANAQLSFPPGGRLAANNDIAGLTVRSISFSASGYQLRGNAIAFTSDAELFDSTAGPNVVACNVALQSDLTVFSTGSTIYQGAGVTLAGALSGPGGITLLGGGRLVLGGNSANTYTGVTRSVHGELQLRKPHGVVAVPGELRIESTMGNSDHGYLSTFANEQIADSAPVIVRPYGTLAIGATERIGPLTLHRPSSIRSSIWWTDAYSGTIVFGGDLTVIGETSGEANGDGSFSLPASRTITFPAEGDSLFLQDVHGVAGAGLTLNADPDPGPGIDPEADIRGDWNGPTVVNGGVVSIVNTQTAVTLQNGRFSGTSASLSATGGEVNGRFLSGGIVSMGDVQLNAATTVALEIVGGNEVRVQLNGTLDLGSTGLEILPSVHTPERQFGLSYTVIENASSQPVIGTFAGLPEGAIVDDRWRISYVGGTGNDVTLTESGHLPSAVGLGVSPSPIVGQPSTYTVTVYASPAIATPTGTATIWKDDLLLATVSIANGTGVATMTLPKGAHDLTVRYSGNTLVAPSEVIQPVTVSPATPAISSVVPSSVPGNSTTTVTIHGSNFAPGAYVLFNSEAAPANVISPTELTFTLRTPSYEGALELQVVYFLPSSVYSAPFPITLTSPLPDPRTKLTFTTSSASAPVAPGAMTAWAARGRRSSGYQVRWYTADGLVTDEDNDGDVTWQWPSATDPMPGSGIWVATDLTTGEIMAGSPYRTTVPRSDSLPPDMFLRDPAGNFSHVIVPVGQVALLQWSRPGVGAWSHYAVDGSADDLDRVSDERVVFNTSIMQPVGASPATPAGVLAGDRFVVVNHDPEQWLGDSVDDHLGNTPGTATVSFPGVGFASAVESEGVVRVFVLREHVSDGTATVDYATSPANSDPGVHYLDQAGQLTFGPGEVVKAIEIPLIDDALYSGPSTFTVTLSNPAGAVLGPTTTASLTIGDDELPPGITLSVPASTALELDAGNHQVPVTVTLQAPAARSITISWSWREGGYIMPNHSGSLVFAPGETQKAFELTYASNTLPEPNRSISFSAGWFPPNEAAITEGGGLTIEDDDFATVSIQDAPVVEGETVNLRLTLSEYSARPVAVSYTISAGNAGAGSDYVAQNGTLTITAPYTAGILSIPTVDDANAEGLERFTVTISSVEGGVLGNATAIVTIVDDDSAALGVPQALSASGAGASVSVSWLAAANATGYEVYRATAGIPSTLVATVTGTAFVDSTVTANKAWVYRVLAVGTGGGKSALSVADYATTVTFDDDPLSAGTNAKSIHLEQLRTAVNAIRGAAALPTVNFTFPVSAGAPIRASHVMQLRAALNEARQALGISALPFTDATLTPGVTKLKAAHVTELRSGCR